MIVLRRIPYWGVLALLIYMPFHIFLAQSVSLATGGLEVWKIAKDVVLGLLTLFTICLVVIDKKGNRLFYWLLGIGVAYFAIHALLWAVYPDLHQKSAILGIIYNTRLPALLILGYGAALLYPKFVFSSIFKVVLGVSTVVAFLGVLQYFLPKDILTYVGYGLERGTRPAFFIDDNPALPRVMSTIREPNALGAYLILPFAALLAIGLRLRDNARRLLIGGMWLLHGLALLLTFSRSAWLGAALAVALVLWWQYKARIMPLCKRWWPLLVATILLFTVVAFTQRNNEFVKSYVTHSTPEAVEDLDSNDLHWLLVREGIEGAIARPLGHGPGTAGIVSIQNGNGGFLTENYYVQIGYEVGIIGLALLVAVSVVVYKALHGRHDYVGAVLLAGFWAYVLTNMLLHTWSSEAVATQWWLLASLAVLARVPKKIKSKAPKNVTT
ncbi:MAG TPA: O-antigen ligase family protein [Candidatus Saccharimonadales bacterium]|nr:O-antigen ligase family protein [Candidatus Saccharimonadales bacterium]